MLADALTRRNIAEAQYAAALAILLAGAGLPADTPAHVDFSRGELVPAVAAPDPPGD